MDQRKNEQSKERSSASLLPWCSSFWNEGPQVTLDYSHQLIYIYIYIYMLYSLHKGLTLLHKYTSTERQRSWWNLFVWSASPVVWGALRSAVFWSAQLGRVLPQHWRFPPASGGHPPGFYPLIGGWVYCLAPLIREQSTGIKVFLAMPDACGLRPCDRNHLKNGLVPNSLVRWGTWQILDQTYVTQSRVIPLA